MQTVNTHEAKTHLSSLLEQVSKGESFIIAKAGKPVAKVVPLDTPEKIQRIGFMKDQYAEVPDDFDTMGQSDIEQLFGIDE